MHRTKRQESGPIDTQPELLVFGDWVVRTLWRYVFTARRTGVIVPPVKLGPKAIYSSGLAANWGCEKSAAALG